LGAGLHPAGGDHDRQAGHQLAQDLPRDAAVADDDAGPQHGGRDPLPQDALHLPAAAQVLGQLVVLVAQAAQVDHLADAGEAGGAGDQDPHAAVLTTGPSCSGAGCCAQTGPAPATRRRYLAFSAASCSSSFSVAFTSWALASARASVASRSASPLASWASPSRCRSGLSVTSPTACLTLPLASSKAPMSARLLGPLGRLLALLVRVGLRLLGLG